MVEDIKKDPYLTAVRLEYDIYDAVLISQRLLIGAHDLELLARTIILIDRPMGEKLISDAKADIATALDIYRMLVMAAEGLNILLRDNADSFSARDARDLGSIAKIILLTGKEMNSWLRYLHQTPKPSIASVGNACVLAIIFFGSENGTKEQGREIANMILQQ